MPGKYIIVCRQERLSRAPSLLQCATMLASATDDNLCAMMRRRLPATLCARLEDTGRLAQQAGIAVYVVGGLVRDLLMGQRTLDADLVVEGDGPAFAGRVADRHGASVTIFARFATASVVFPDGFKMDVATARQEQYAHPGALPTITPASIRDDLIRRDFTINTLAVRLNADRFGEVLDYYGGLRDLEKNTLRSLHDRSFVDDPTRLFRAIRYEQRFGFRIEARTLRLLKDAAATDLASRLSGPRLRNEIMRLLAEPNPRRIIRRMGALTLLRFLHPRLTLTPRLTTLLAGIPPAVRWWTTRFPDRAVDHPLLYMMALMASLPMRNMNAALTRLAFPNRQADKVRLVKTRLASPLRVPATSQSVKPSRAYRLYAGLSDEGLILLAAHAGTQAVRDSLSAYLTTYRHVKPLLTGEALKTMGLTPGPRYRTILDRLLDAKLNGVVRSKTDERAFVKRLTKP